MKHPTKIVVGLLIAAILLLYMVSYTLRYDEQAVVTTFQKATPESVETDPGLKWRAPWPIQQVQVYPNRLQLLDDQQASYSTKDNYTVVLQTYLAWQIDNPYEFYVSVRDLDTAESRLEPMLEAEAKATVGRYNFDDLISVDEQGEMTGPKLDQIEAEILASIQSRLQASQGEPLGIKVRHVGVRRMVLPEAVTSRVFERMRATRQTMAAEIRSRGEAEAAAIRSEANAAQRTILSFAQRRAEAIEAEGLRLAQDYYSEFARDEEFANFLLAMESLEQILADKTTFVLNAREAFPFNFLPNVTADGNPATATTAGGVR